jgi:hypothetical protein
MATAWGVQKSKLDEAMFRAEEKLRGLQQQRLDFINAGLSGGFEYSKVSDWANEEFGLKTIMAEQRIEDLKRLNRNV